MKKRIFALAAAVILAFSASVPAAAESEAKQTGWVKTVSGEWDEWGTWYYIDPVTLQYRTGWLQDNGAWYYLYPEDGVMAQGWLWDNGKWYYAEYDGKFYQKTWATTFYTPQDDDAIFVGSEPVEISGTIQWSRYFRSDCSMAVGWEKIGADWYYFKADGSVYNGWLSSGGKWYYLKDGVMQANTTVDGYQIGSDGVWIR